MSITIKVKSASDLPNKDSIGTSDPYVTIIFQGKKSKTEVIQSSLNPVWNEVIKFDLGNKPLQSDECIDIEVKDHERIGWNKLLGKTVLPLRNIVHGSSSQLEVNQTLLDENDQATPAKINMSVAYTPKQGDAAEKKQPTSTISSPAEVSEGSLARENVASGHHAGDLSALAVGPLTVRNRDKLSNVTTKFQIRVRIVEARQLLGEELCPVCRVVFGNRIQQTKIRRSSSAPWFDQLFFFYEEMVPNKLMEEFLEFKVCNSRVLRSESVIGTFKFELGNIYDQPEHATVNKWLVLAHPDEPTPTVQGYLKVSVAVLGPGDTCADMTASVNDSDDIESNLLWSSGVHLQPASFTLSVYLAQNLPRMDSGAMQSLKEAFGFGKASKELVDPYVIASYAGREVQTRVLYTNDNPVFRQKIQLGFLFPSMCNTLKISLMDWDRVGNDDVIGSAVIPISEISAPGDEGFLPTFGPCFVNVYGARREWEIWEGKSHTKMNKGDKEGCSYRGRVLVSLDTCVGSYPSTPTTDMDDATFNDVRTYRGTREFVVVAHITHAFLLKEASRPLEIEVSIGNFGNKLESSLLPSPSSTHPSNPVFDGCRYYYLPWGESVPLIMVECEFEDVTQRMMASNAVLNIAKTLERDLSAVKIVIKSKKANKSSLAVSFEKIIAKLAEMCRKPLPKPDTSRHIETSLDASIRTRRRRELDKIVKLLNGLLQKDSEEVVEELEIVHRRLIDLAKEPQTNVPDIFLWLLSGTERLAYARIDAQSVLHSTEADWSGSKAGKFDSIMMKYPEDSKGAKIGGVIRSSIWFGRVEDLPSWWQARPDLQMTVFAETYENQVISSPGSGKWTNKGALMRRPSFSDADGMMNLPREQFRPSQGWKFQGEWFVDPDPSTTFSSDAGHTVFCEEVFEQQARVPGSTWIDLPQATWADIRGDPDRPRNEIKCAEGWEWRDAWTTDLQRAVDSEGWEYTVKKGITGWSPQERLYHVLRRRRWIRERNRMTKVKSEEKLKDGWEYSAFFSKRFHARERGIDIVRRRRWRRKLVPSVQGVPETPRITVASDVGVNEDKAILNTCPRQYVVSAELHSYQLRAHLYQARDISSGDKSGLSDPYAIVCFCGYTQQTEKQSNTLSPTWDQTLVFDCIKISGPLLPANDICKAPAVIVEIYDWDARGEPDFLGRVTCDPLILNPKEGYQPPKLSWYQLQKGTCQKQGELLAAFELLLKETNDLPMPPPARGDLFMVPFGVRPLLQKTRIEILCWGVRNMSTYELQSVTRPSIEFECGGRGVTSTIMKNIRHNPNFQDPHLVFDVELPKAELFMPPLTIRVLDHRSFGSKPLVATSSIIDLHKYNVEPKSARKSSALTCAVTIMTKIQTNKKSRPLSVADRLPKLKSHTDETDEVSSLDKKIDWWSKYYASTNDPMRAGSYLEKGYEKLEIINGNLESDHRYDSFRDLIDTIPLYRGRLDKSTTVGEFKGTFRIYPLGSDKEDPPKVLEGLPSPDPQDVIVRVYVISAKDLAPKDSGSSSDPYVVVSLGKQTQCSKDEYKVGTLNPVFGRMFEVKATIPLVKDLKIQIWDKDKVSSDDLIGETTIDLENRFLSRYRASVGLPKLYHTSGPNTWRDYKLPSEILQDVAKIRHLEGPHWAEGSVSFTLDGKTYALPEFEPEQAILPPTLGDPEERLSLHALRALVTLVQEHVEERPLHHSERPDLPQGLVSLWVDLFPASITLPPPLDITPRQPVKYVLRVCIYNVYEAPLDETSVTGEQMSDVYIKGWLEGTNNVQKTDIHYRCMDGEANFNWRLVYHFDYLEAEQMMIISRKMSLFSCHEQEDRRPPQLTLQLWDNDLLMKDDYLSEMNINLSSLPIPSKSLSKVSLEQKQQKNQAINGVNTNLFLSDVDKSSSINLFDTKRVYGYFPFKKVTESGALEMAGKLEAEFEVLTETEAETRSAGQGRDAPNTNPTLAEPKRPATSFLWMTSPWKSFKFIVWKNFKWYIITTIVLFFLLLFILLFIYALPGATIDYMLGV